MVKQKIPHECDPSICSYCNGKAFIWQGRDKSTGEFLGNQDCPVCEGTGKTIWAD